MPPMLLSTSILLFASSVSAVITHYQATGDCVSTPRYGSQLCCMGAFDDPSKCSPPSTFNDWPFQNDRCADLDGHLCPPNAVAAGHLDPTAEEYGGTCETGNSFYRNVYNYTCCQCPPGTQPDSPCAIFTCVGCSSSSEVLQKDTNGTWECAPKTIPTSSVAPNTTSSAAPSATTTPAACKLAKRGSPACPLPDSCDGLTTYQSPRLTGAQAVISTDFVNDLKRLIDCVSVEGGKAKLNIVSSSRCGASRGNTPAKGISDHELGRAVDANLILPDGTGCDFYCMGRAYCAFNATKPSCRVFAKQPQNARNAFVNNFYKCARAPNFEVGADFPKGDWNHFERDIPYKNPKNKDAEKLAAYRVYNPKLKSFCKGLCPKAAKVNPAPEMCQCF